MLLSLSRPLQLLTHDINDTRECAQGIFNIKEGETSASRNYISSCAGSFSADTVSNLGLDKRKRRDQAGGSRVGGRENCPGAVTIVAGQVLRNVGIDMMNFHKL